MITMGKTPFGDLRRSWALVIIGMGTAILGIITSFIPGYFTKFVQLLVGIVLFAGGIVLFLQLCISEKKARMWIKIAGILRQLTIACALVYALTIISGLITLFPGLRSDPRTAIVLMFYGMSFFYLSWCIWKVARTYGPEKPDDSASTIRSSDRADSQGRFSLFREASLPLSPAILILSGFLNTLLGLLLFPVGLGMLPFSPDGQLGLTSDHYGHPDDDPGRHPARPVHALMVHDNHGIVFAGLGVVSCVVPGMLTGMIQILLGLLTVLGGAVFFIRRFLARNCMESAPPRRSKLLFPRLLEKWRGLNGDEFAGHSLRHIHDLAGSFVSSVVACILFIMGPLLFILASLIADGGGNGSDRRTAG